MVRRSILSATLILLVAGTASAQVRLEHKYLPGTHVAETTSKIDQKLSIAGMDTDTLAETKVKTTVTVGKRDGAGMVPIQEKIESMQVNTTVMGNQYTFDSAKPDEKGTSPLEILRDVHKALARRTTTTLMNKNNRVESIKDDNDVLGSLPVEVQQLVQSQFDTENQKKIANQQLDQFPTQPISKGESWERTETANFGAGQVMTFKTQMKYEGTVEKDGKKLEKITTKVLSADFALENSPLPFTLKGSSLKVPESEGVILFDLEAGRAVESSSSLRIVGDINFAIQTMDLPAKLDLKMSTSVISK